MFTPYQVKLGFTMEVLADLHQHYLQHHSCRDLVAVARERHGLNVTPDQIEGAFRKFQDEFPLRKRGSPGATRGFEAFHRTAQKVRELAELYESEGSVEKAAAAYCARHGITLSRQSVFDLLKRHGIAIRPRAFKEVRIINGERYSKDAQGYWRLTSSGSRRIGSRGYAHVRAWEAVHGKLPAGKRLMFIDGDRDNISVDNLLLVTAAEQAKLTNTGKNGFGEGGSCIPHDCLQCGRPLKPHEKTQRRKKTETPSAFNERKFCNPSCKAAYFRGRPLKSGPATWPAKKAIKQLPCLFCNRMARRCGRNLGGQPLYSCGSGCPRFRIGDGATMDSPKRRRMA